MESLFITNILIVIIALLSIIIAYFYFFKTEEKITTATTSKNSTSEIHHKSEQKGNSEIENLQRKAIKSIQPYEMDDGRIGMRVPFQSLYFLTKDLNPIVNEQGHVIVSIKKETNVGLLIKEKIEKEKEKENISNDAINNIKFPEQKQEEELTTTEHLPEMDDLPEMDNLPEMDDLPEMDNLPEMDDLPEMDNLPEIDDSQEIGGLLDTDDDDINNINIEEEFKKAQQVQNKIQKEKEHKTETELFQKPNLPTSSTKKTIIETEKEKAPLPTSSEEAEEFYTSTFHPKSFTIYDETNDQQGIANFEDSIDYIYENIDNIQKSFLENLIVDNKIIQLNDKSLVINNYDLIKTLAKTISNSKENQTTIFNKLKKDKSNRILKEFLAFIIENKEFITTDQNKIFQTMSLQKGNKLCKIYGIKLSPNILKSYFEEYFDIMLKYPQKKAKFSNKTAEKFCS